MMKSIKLLDPSVLQGVDFVGVEQLRELEAASRVIETAELWAAAHREAAVEDIEAERVAAFEKAYLDGLAGFEAAVGTVEKEVVRMSDKLLDLLKKCLDHILSETPTDEVIRATIEPIIRSVVPNQTLSLAVHPKRQADVEKAIVQFSNIQDRGLSIEITPDESLTETECLLFTEAEVIDASIPLIIDQLVAAVADHIDEVPDGVT